MIHTRRGSPTGTGDVRGRARTRLAVPTAVCALLSFASTAAVAPTDPGAAGGSRSYWSLAETGLLLVLTAAVVRWSPPCAVRAVVPLTVLAVGAWPARTAEGSFLEGAGAVAFWLIPVAVAVAVGAYPRRAAARRLAAVDAARREQRLVLSRDLHDFVAHDISAIVVQAQTARFIAENDPGAGPRQAALALERIERAGLSALASMDRTIALLHGDGDGDGAASANTEALPGPDRLPALVAEFAAIGVTGGPGGVDAVWEADEDAVRALSREAGAAAYRIVAEALTNVRRHAPGAFRIVVRLRLLPPGGPEGVELSITDDGGDGGGGGVIGARDRAGGRGGPTGRQAGPRADGQGEPLWFRRPRRARGAGGLGLPGLAEHVTALGGTFTAGPGLGGGWSVVAVFPRTPPEPCGPSGPSGQSGPSAASGVSGPCAGPASPAPS
ncbi:two component sensor kinase MppV [Streptomyces clavuligerus]|nr:two component sensor kinase MppV [Streptomyces clavuligerus]